MKPNYLPKIIAHRGASAYAPENTLEAFRLARELGASCVELDVVLTRLGEPVVIHDQTLRRTTRIRGKVSEYSYAELLNYEVGSWFNKKFYGVKIPHLEEVIQLLLNLGLKANFDLKGYGGNEKKLAKCVLNILQRFWLDQKKMPLLSSFSVNCLRALREISDTVSLGMILSSWGDFKPKIFHEINCQTLHVNRRFLSKKAITWLMAETKQIYVYTINNALEAQKFFDLGIKGVFTDYPDVLLSRLRQLS